jgi:D-lactate dehydrogenase (cytochrome)
MHHDRMNEPVPAAALMALAAVLGDRVTTSRDLCRQHANAVSWLPVEPPEVVVWPVSTADVVAIVRIAAKFNVPLIPFGAGTSLEGHVNAPCGGIALDMSRMNRVVAVRTADLDCTVEAGVTRGDLNRHLRDTGLFFPVDPGAETATLGGMASTRASGTTTVRYGTMADNVRSMTVVLADGSVIETGTRAAKSAAGLDLTQLFIGAEGTLGIITELTLRLHPVPQAIGTVVAAFETMGAACEAAMMAVTSEPLIARLELLDALTIGAVNRKSALGLAEGPSLFIEVHGARATIDTHIEALDSLLRDAGASRCQRASALEDRTRLWRARHDAFWAVCEAWPGRSAVVSDACVPLSRLSDCIIATQADIRDYSLVAPIVGHVGDGNFHAIVMVDPSDVSEMARTNTFLDRLGRRAIAMGGTCTGEHGIGQGKRELLALQAGPALPVMHAIKRALDPSNILNPGKIF